MITSKEDKKKLLRTALIDINLFPNDIQLDQLIKYYELVLGKNQVMNLTTITEYEEFVMKHFVDSLIISREVNFDRQLRMIDIGSGAGFPGIPLKIMFPKIEVVLLDSLNKKVLFLTDVIDELELTGITAIHERAEEPAKRKEYREQFDVCVSRAVANLTTLVEFCLPYVNVGGIFVSYKAGGVEAEVEEAAHAISVLGGELVKRSAFDLPGTDIKRTFLHVKKVVETPIQFPRSAGTPSKEPLK